MKWIECPSCHGRCDPGDMLGGTCLECREEERQRIVRNDSVIRMVNGPFQQLEFNFGGKSCM